MLGFNQRGTGGASDAVNAPSQDGMEVYFGQVNAASLDQQATLGITPSNG